jgi:hypothetical protein
MRSKDKVNPLPQTKAPISQEKKLSGSTRRPIPDSNIRQPDKRSPIREGSSQRIHLLTTDNEFELVYKVKNSGKTHDHYD